MRVRSLCAVRKQLSGNEPSRILILRFSALGDVIQTLPMLTWLRAQYPNAKIGWAIDEELVPAIEGHACLDHIHGVPRKRWAREAKKPENWARIAREYAQYIAQIRNVEYDLAVDTQSLFKTAFTAYCAGIKRRVGYAHNREMSGLFLNEKYMTFAEYFEPSAFHMDHIGRLAREVGCSNTDYVIEPPVVQPEIEAKVARLLSHSLPSQNKIVAIAPGTQWVSKHWPDHHWVTLISLILTRTDLNVILVGSKGDAPLSARIYDQISDQLKAGRVADLAGQTNIREMYALYRHPVAAIGADSAPQHVAGAVKTPCVIAIFGPTAHRRTAPFGSPFVRSLSTEGTLSCQPCHKKVCPLGTTDCMRLITPEAVFIELVRGLQECGIAFGSNLSLSAVR